ncbi:7746_t:CDS:2, partial [Diversispora eburnea]
MVRIEVGARFTNLEQRDKEKSDLIAKLQQSDKEKTNLITKPEQNDKDTVARVAKLEQKQLQDDEKSKLYDDTKENNQSLVDDTSTETESSNNTHGQINLQRDDTPISDVPDITSNSDELNNAPNSDNFSEEPISQTQSTIPSEIKIPYNQKVEQGLIHELFEFIRGTDFMSLQNLKKTPLNSIFIKQISDIPVDIDLTPGSAPPLAHLFGKAEKTGRKEKLRWYYYKTITISTPSIQTLHTSNSINEISGEVKSLSESEDNIPTESLESFNDNDDENKINVTFSYDDENKINVTFSYDDDAEKKSTIHEVVYKHFFFLSYTKSNAWYQDVFKYINSKAKCPICNKVHSKAGLCQYAIEHGMNLERFAVITEAEKKRCDRKYF